MFQYYAYIWTHVVLPLCIYVKSRIHMWKKKYVICLSEYNLFYLIWFSPVASLLSKRHDFILFWGCIKYPMYVMLPFLLSFLCWWTHKLIPWLSYCEWCCNKHGWARVSMVTWIRILLGLQECIVGSHLVHPIFSFLSSLNKVWFVCLFLYLCQKLGLETYAHRASQRLNHQPGRLSGTDLDPLLASYSCVSWSFFRTPNSGSRVSSSIACSWGPFLLLRSVMFNILEFK